MKSMTIFLITLGVVLSLVVWFLFLGLMILGGGIEGSNFLKGIVQTLFVWYPLAALVAIATLWIKKDILWASLPFVILLIACIVLAISGAIKDSRIYNSQRESDRIFVSYDLDGVAQISVPQSFEQNTHDLIARNFYSLDLSGESFTYLFRRDSYGSIGGRRDPVSLGLRIYKQGIPVPSLNVDYYDYRNFDDVSFKDIGENLISGKEKNPSLAEPYSIKGFLIYTDPLKKYRLYMTYWDTHLSDKAALDMFKKIVSSIVITGSLEERIQSIAEEFYRENPDKKP